MDTDKELLDEPPLSSHIRLPPFSMSNPRLWFAQVEAHYRAHRIRSQSVMYSYVVTALTPEIAEEVEDFITDMPEKDPYNTLKDAVISRTAVSDQRRLDELFSNVEIGDRTPSQLLRYMRQLLGKRTLDDVIFKQLWMKRLPARTREILAVFPRGPIDELATAADKMLEVSPPPPQVAACALPPPATAVTTADARLDRLESMFEQLVLQLSRSRSPANQQRRDRSNSRPRRSSSRPNGDPNHCWYHQQYGDRSRKCTPPCTFASGNLKSGQ